jgi:hypothetical protein
MTTEPSVPQDGRLLPRLELVYPLSIPRQRIVYRTHTHRFKTTSAKTRMAGFRVIEWYRGASLNASTLRPQVPRLHHLSPPIYAPKCLELGRRFSQLLDTLSSLCGAPAESALGQKGSLDDAALFCKHAHLVHGLRAFQGAASSA